jgi:hypothetical protein
VNTCSAPYHMKTDKRTYADRAEYLKKAVAQRRKKLMQQAIEYKGGNCMICGYNKCIRALTFHHVDEELLDHGKRSKTNSINVFCYVPIVMPKCTMVLRSFRSKDRSKNEVNCWKPSYISTHVYGNQQPILQILEAGSETIPQGSTSTSIVVGNASPQTDYAVGDDIVHALRKRLDYV